MIGTFLPFTRTIILYMATAVLFGLPACSFMQAEPEQEAKTEAVDVLYNRARDSLAEKNYKTATDQFQEVERQYPYAEWAKQAQIMAAYSAYKGQKYDEAIGIVERFAKLHPTSEAAPYAYYLRALCFYEQIADVGRDQKTTQDALDALTEVIKRFPGSAYARDAKLKRDLTIDHLAGKEMEVGRYYLVRKETLAAINRFKYVVDNYQTTTHVPEALHRLVECYSLLGVAEEAEKYAAVLGYNYPGSDWYRDSYALLKGEAKTPKPKKGFFTNMLGK